MCSSDVNCLSALSMRPVARLPSGGCIDRGAAGAEGGGCGRGCPPPAGGGVWEDVFWCTLEHEFYKYLMCLQEKAAEGLMSSLQL